MSTIISRNVHPLSLHVYGLPRYPRGLFRATHKQMLATEGMIADPCSRRFRPSEFKRLLGIKACKPIATGRTN